MNYLNLKQEAFLDLVKEEQQLLELFVSLPDTSIDMILSIKRKLQKISFELDRRQKTD